MDNDNEFVEISEISGYMINRSGVIKNSLTGRISKQSIINGYKRVSLKINGKHISYYTHRLLALTFIPNPSDKRCVDHIDGDRLNNTLSNLRWATAAENQYNAKKTTKTTSSQYKGVYFNNGKWIAQIKSNSIYYYLGRFNSEEEAALEYNVAALNKFGEFAKLNVIDLLDI
jgi:hypothetical protein